MAQILIIDDDPAIQMLLKRSLSRSGYEVVIAPNGEEGIAAARSHPPALILCDWIMPGIDGLEVCRQVKAIPDLSTTIFILLTSLGSVEDRVKGLDAGADDFLCKPIEMNELQARLRAGLRLHQLSEDLRHQKQLIEAELAEAADYVRSILPDSLHHPSVQIEGCFLPSRQLGGDGFDYFWLDSQHLVMYLLDVSGHGLGSALPSVSVINSLRYQGLSQVNYYRPSEVLYALNKAFQISQRNDKYFTIWYGVYHQNKRTLTYASAGHPPAILIHSTPSGELSEQLLKTPGFPVGMFEYAQYKNKKCKIPPDSTLYLFSDGIYEVERKNGLSLGLEAFISILKQYQQQDNRELLHLFDLVKSATETPGFNDDLSLLKISFSTV